MCKNNKLIALVIKTNTVKAVLDEVTLLLSPTLDDIWIMYKKNYIFVMLALKNFFFFNQDSVQTWFLKIIFFQIKIKIKFTFLALISPDSSLVQQD